MSQLGSDSRWIVTGDFNASPSELPYSALFDASGDRKLLDTYRVIHPNPQANEGTFSSFKGSNTTGPRIDWIGCSEDFQVRLARIDRTSRDGRTPSDHFPVTAVLRPASKNAGLRVLSYNIHHGRGVDEKLSLQRIASVIRQADADVVALQEVDQGCGRSDRALQVPELEKLTGYYGAFGKAIDFDGGEYGQAILSRWPIHQTAIHQLPNEQQTNGSMREQRIVFEAIVSSEIGTIRFLGTHLDHAKEDLREKQALAVDGLLDRVSFPEANSVATVLAGDFNDVPKSKVLRCFDKRWLIDPGKESLELATYPSQSPRTRIDYVAVDRSGKLVLDALEVLPEPIASDHRPVLAELVIP